MRCQGADSPLLSLELGWSWSLELQSGALPPCVGPLTPAQPCNHVPTTAPSSPCPLSGKVKWGPQKDTPASEPLEPAIMSLFENRWDLPTGAIQVLR